MRSNRTPTGVLPPLGERGYLLGYCRAGIGRGRFVLISGPSEPMGGQDALDLLMSFRPVTVINGTQFEDFFPLNLRRRRDRVLLNDLNIEWLRPGPLSDAIHSIAFGWMPDWQTSGRRIEIAHPLPPVPLSLNEGLASLVDSLKGYTPQQSEWMTPGTLGELSRAVDALPPWALSVIDETLSYFGYGLALVPLDRDASGPGPWLELFEEAGEHLGSDGNGAD